jgi:D-sedoheptulose 7-phosphate isomerase
MHFDFYDCSSVFLFASIYMSFETFVEDYYLKFAQLARDFDKTTMPQVLDVLTRVSAVGGTVWVAGNGGSAAISDHTVCDVTKGTHADGMPPFKSVSMASNGPMLTALANDISYDEVFSKQLEFYLGSEDAVLLVSSSGNSPNVIKACEYANSRGVPTIAFTGFSGGKLKELATISVWIPVDNYGMTEDLHQSLIHVITQYIHKSRKAD